MKLIVGLGNPEEKYLGTRHNIGFKVIDAVAHNLNVELDRTKFNGLFYKGHDFILAKPLTYMNRSGIFVQAIMDFFRIEPCDILVIYDDMDHKVGQAVIKSKGSANGQKGMLSIIEKLGMKEIPRMKIGIGRPKGDVVNYVLNKFSGKEVETLNSIKGRIVEAVKEFLFEDIEKAMSGINSMNR